MTAAQLRRWRAVRGWTQREAGEATGYTEGTWREIESGRRDIPAPLLKLIRCLDGK